MKKLQTRIMVPFLVLFLVVTLISSFLIRYCISQLMDDRISRETARVSRILSNSEFVLNPVYLNKLRDIIEGDIIILEKTGRVIVSTLSDQRIAEFVNQINSREVFSSLQKGNDTALRTTLKKDRITYLITSRIIHIDSYPQNRMLLCILSPLTDVLNAKLKITRQMFIIGLFSLLLSILVAYIISKTVTKPINDLVSITGDIAEGNFKEKAALPAIKELKRLASSINAMMDKLMEYEDQVIRSSKLAAAGKITAAMAHEIRNPLSSIKMMAQLLRNRIKDEPDKRKIIDPLLEEISRLERIVKDLTDLMNPSQLSLNSTDINNLIEEILPVIEPKLTHRKIKLTKNLQRPLPEVEVDKDKLKQVIWNLIVNAMESMPDGGTIKINSFDKKLSENSESKIIEITVEDEGCGIKDGTLEKIFTHFFTTKQEGLGLGLSISKEIMKNHGGDLTIENMNEKGVRASIRIPVG